MSDGTPPSEQLMRPLMVDVAEYDVPRLLTEWQWLLPTTDTPLFVSALGDWVFGAPDGSLWCLSVLEGDYRQIASDARQYNTLNKSAEWLDQTFLASWQEIALRHGLDPTIHECLGWKLHPLLGGKFEVDNLKVFSMVVYQSLMGQLHRHFHKVRSAHS
jgi:hypothetical protein